MLEHRGCWHLPDFHFTGPTHRQYGARNSRWLFFCYLCFLNMNLNIVFKTCIFSSRYKEKKIYLYTLKPFIPYYICPIPEHLCICSYDLNFKRPDKGKQFALKYRVLILMQDTCWAIWYSSLPTLPLKNRHNTKQGKRWQKINHFFPVSQLILPYTDMGFGLIRKTNTSFPLSNALFTPYHWQEKEYIVCAEVQGKSSRTWHFSTY